MADQKTSKDVPTELLTEQEVKDKASVRLKVATSDIVESRKKVNTYLKNTMGKVFAYGEALRDVKLIFKHNKVKMDVFEAWAHEFTGDAPSTIRAYIQVFESKSVLGNACGFADARDMISFDEKDEKGQLKTRPKAKREKASPLTEKERTVKILEQIARVKENTEVYAVDVIVAVMLKYSLDTDGIAYRIEEIINEEKKTA